MDQLIKFSVEITDTMNRLDFREFCKIIREKKYIGTGFEYEMWIITTNNTINYVNVIAEQLEVPSTRIVLCTNNTTKVGQIVSNNMDMHLDADYEIINALNATPVKSIMVDSKLDYQLVGNLYITHFGKFTEIILRERAEANGEKVWPC